MKILSIETSCDDPSTRAKLSTGREEIISLVSEITYYENSFN